MAIRRLDELCLVAKIFHDFELATNLKLKPKKSILIATVLQLSGWNLDMIRAWLTRAVPHWENLVIKDSAKYLGFFIGPTSGASQWIAAAQKYSERVVSIKHMKLPLRLAVNRHNYYAVPVLGYIAQLALPPPHIVRFELSAILQALGFAGNSMTCETAFSMGDLLGFTPTRPSVYMESCMIRSAFKTFAGIPEMHFELAGKARESSCLSSHIEK